MITSCCDLLLFYENELLYNMLDKSFAAFLIFDFNVYIIFLSKK